MRVAVAGKGGAGKTTITATLARIAARRGRHVLCIDADSNPNLGPALGIDTEVTAPTLPARIVSRRLDGGPALTIPIDEVLAAHTITGPDGVQVALMGMPGHAEEGCMCSAHGVVRATLADLDSPDVVALVDMEASPEHFSRGTARHVDAVVFVTEPYYRSMETARRMAELAAELPIPTLAVVGNKLRDPIDHDAITAFCANHELDLIGQVPWGGEVLDADRDRIPLIEAAPEGDVVRSIAGVLDELTRRTAPAQAPAGT